MADKEKIERLIRGLEAGDEAALEREFHELYAEDRPGFGADFEDRVMAGTLAAPREKDIDYFLPRLFRWIAVAGVAAAAALLVMTYIAEDDLSIDALAGINQVSVEEAANLNL